MTITVVDLIHLVIVVLFGLAAFNVPAPRPVNWGWLGVFLWSLTAFVRW